MAKDLRLLLFPECNRRCKGCCNKDWDLKALPSLRSFEGFKTVMLTGGEPMLNPALVKAVARICRMQAPEAKVIVYTAKTDPAGPLVDVLKVVDGVTVTLHTKKDIPLFARFNEHLQAAKLEGKSLRLNVFKGLDVGKLFLSGWTLKTGIEWIKDCPLPENEVFMRWN
jgi:MoaA/NifB/PqqE/SkfB family radical SAM enzyme